MLLLEPTQFSRLVPVLARLLLVQELLLALALLRPLSALLPSWGRRLSLLLVLLPGPPLLVQALLLAWLLALPQP